MLSLFKRFYPILSAIYEGIFFIYQLLYMYNHTVFFTPFLHLQGLAVKRVSAHDLMQQRQREATKKMLRSNEGLLKNILLSMSDAGHLLLDFVKYLLPTTIFVFKFLEWWYSENRLNTTSEPIPPPPDPPKARRTLSLHFSRVAYFNSFLLRRIENVWWSRCSS